MNGPIRVLLVDDDSEWLNFTADLLEHWSDSIAVDQVENAATALDAIDAADGTAPPFDCVVSDFHLGGVDGLQLLDRIRERHPDLPFILVTGMGNEQVASEAIRRGVTDYVVKAGPDATGITLTNRIENTVEKWRTARELEEAREQYSVLFDEVPDPIVVTDDDGQIRSANPAFVEISGDDPSAAIGERLEDVLDEVDRCRDDRDERRDGYVDRVARYRSSDGERYFRGRCVELETAGDRRCWIFTDVTEQVERERSIRGDRDVREAVRDVMVSETTRREIERELCERLADHLDLALVWIGEPNEEELVPRTAVGETEYLDGVDLTFGDERPPEPGVRAARSGETVVIDDLAASSGDGSVPGSDVNAAADERGFAAAVGVPLAYGVVDYGVLVAYAAGTDALDSRRVRLLEDVAEALSFVINAFEKTRALLAEEVVEVRFVVTDERYPLARLSRSKPFVEGLEGPLLIEGIVLDSDDRMTKFASAEVAADAEPPTLARELEAATDGVSVEHVGTTADRARFRLSIEPPNLGSILTDHGGTVDEIEVSSGSAAATVTLPGRTDVRSVYESVSAYFPETELGRMTRRDTSGGVRWDALEGAELTDRQRQVLETAYRSGFFERPKRSNAEELARSLEIARSTFLQHLRVAESKVFATLFDG